MVDRVRTVDFLPQIFQTPVNRQFLNATLDQLTQEPAFQKTEGFIGRTVGPGVNPEDRYVIEPDKVRSDYQLEPGVVSLDPTATTKITSTTTPIPTTTTTSSTTSTSTITTTPKSI